MRFGKTTAAAVGAAMLITAAGAAHAAEADWRTVVEESFAGGEAVLNYTVYKDTDTAEVAVSVNCPDDSGGYTVSGVQYCGQNYQGSPDGGICANITKYVKNGDRLRFSMEYKSMGYNGTEYGIDPFVEIRHNDGTKNTYELKDAGGADTWTAYSSDETDELEFGASDSVHLVIKNIRGYWHIKDLKIERYGTEDFIKSLTIDGLDGNKLRDGSVTITGAGSEGADMLCAALYSGGRLRNVSGLEQKDGEFTGAVDASGADTLKIMAWDGEMRPYMNSVTVTADGTGNYSAEEETDEMKEKYKDYFLMGNIYNPVNLYGADKEILLKHFNAVTAENLMKPLYIAPSEGTYNFSDTDVFLDFAERNGLEVIAHTLVWHQQTADWLTSGTASEVSENLKNYITETAGHCRGRVKGWDVVNEALSDGLSSKPETWKQGLRTDSPWYTGTNNPEYIYNSYVWARAADPEAELYYNDYNLDNPYKREAAALLVKHVNDRYKSEYNTDENLIKAIGMQSHYNLLTNTDDVRASIERFREIGVHVNISELDICLNQVFDNGLGDNSSGVTLTPALETRQAAKYAELMSIYKANADIIDRVTFWGYNDGASWRSAQYPLMFNSDLSPKKAYYAIMEPENYK